MPTDPQHAALATIARWGALDPAGDRLELSDEISMVDLLAGLRRQRLTGVFASAVDQGAIDLDPEVRAELVDQHRDAMAEVLLLESTLLEVLDVLESAEVPSRLLKGSALAHLVSPSPEQRSFGDVDLLVDAGRVDAAVSSLGVAGARRLHPRLRAGFDRRFAKSVTMVWPNQVEIDLHRTLAPGPFGLGFRLPLLFDDPAAFELADRSVLTLPPVMHLVHGAIHVALGDTRPRLGNLRDLVLLMRDDETAGDAVPAAAARLRAEAPVAAGLRLVADELGPIEHAALDWARARPTSAREREWLATSASADDRFGRQARVSLTALPWRDRPAYLAAVLLPERANLASRSLTRRSHLASLTRRLGRR